MEWKIKQTTIKTNKTQSPHSKQYKDSNHVTFYKFAHTYMPRIYSELLCIGSLTKDLGWRHHPNGKYIMAAKMPVQGSHVYTLDSLVALTPSRWYHTHYFSSKTGSTACFRWLANLQYEMYFSVPSQFQMEATF